MHPTLAISILSALGALASPITITTPPRSPNPGSAPAPAPAQINKRFEASVPWIWRPRKSDFEQFDDGTSTETDAAEEKRDVAANGGLKKRVDVYWGWFARDAEGFKEEGADAGETPGVAEGPEGDAITKRHAEEVNAGAAPLKKRVDVYWGWFARDAEGFKEEQGGDVVGEGAGAAE